MRLVSRLKEWVAYRLDFRRTRRAHRLWAINRTGPRRERATLTFRPTDAGRQRSWRPFRRRNARSLGNIISRATPPSLQHRGNSDSAPRVSETEGPGFYSEQAGGRSGSDWSYGATPPFLGVATLGKMRCGYVLAHRPN